MPFPKEPSMSNCRPALLLAAFVVVSPVTVALQAAPALVPAAAAPGDPPLLPRATVAAIAEETSGEAAKRSLEFLSRQHRMRGSRGFRAAAEFVAGELRAAGLERVEIVEIP